MLDIKLLRENLSQAKQALDKKRTMFDVDGLLKLDDARKQALSAVEKLRSERNKISKEKDSKRGKLVKEALKKAEQKLVEVDHAFADAMAKLHNLPHESVPRKDKGNEVVKTWGKPPKFDFKPKDHLELGERLDIIDVKRAVKMSGTRFGILKNQAVDLEFALVNWVFDKLAAKGFTKLVPPALVREQAMWGSGFFPTERQEYYKTATDDLYLTGTAEVPLASYHANEVLDVKQLPLKYTAFSSCFRREAGSYGKDTRGIFRVHQFDKVEMFVYAHPDNSWEEFENLAAISREIFQELALPYRQINMHGGELGAPNAKKYDFEVLIPSHNDYRELASLSHDTDFQARRLNIKISDGRYVHTLNDTAIAIGRTIVAILENYQQQDGSVKMPEVLHKYLPFTEIKR